MILECVYPPPSLSLPPLSISRFIALTSRRHFSDKMSLIDYVRSQSKLCSFPVIFSDSNNPTEGHGVTVLGHQPAGVSSSLSVTNVMSYLECVLLCGQDHRCRVAEFNFDLLTCVTLGPGSHSGLTPNPQSQTFVRNGFP